MKRWPGVWLWLARPPHAQVQRPRASGVIDRWQRLRIGEEQQPGQGRSQDVVELHAGPDLSRGRVHLACCAHLALNDELIEFDPFERIALKKLLKQTSKSSEYEVDPFTQEERARLLEVARPDEKAMLQFWFNTGLRPGELMALLWPKIDWVGRTARIDLNLVAKTLKGPKTEAGIRDVELNDDAIAALIAQKPATFLAQEQVWHNPRTTTPWEADAQIRKTLWQPLCTRAGVRYRNPYQVRHAYASELLTSGENPWYVAQQLGHVDVQMVFKIYGKFIRQDYQRPKAKALRTVRD